MFKTESVLAERLDSRSKSYYVKMIDARDLIIIITALLLSRVTVFNGMAPFGLAFYSTLLSKKSNQLRNLILLVSISIGSISTGMGFSSTKYIFAGIVFYSIYSYSAQQFTGRRFLNAVIAFSVLFITGLFPTIFQGALLYDFLILINEAFLVFVMVLIFETGIPVLLGRIERKVLSNEEMISLSILLGLAVAGVFEINLPAGISLKNVLCIVIILIFSLKHGAGIAATSGITIGLINSMESTKMPILVGSFAFCGLISGVFKSFGKIGVCLGFILANIIYTLYVNGSTEVLISINDILLATIILSLIPSKFLDAVGVFLNKNSNSSVEKRLYSRKVKDITVEKLESVSDAFEQLANTFSSIAYKEPGFNTKDITVFFDQVAEKACRNCSLCLNCWEREFHSTYQNMFEIMERLEEKGKIGVKDVPSVFGKRCIKIESFLSYLNNMYEMYKLNLLWHKKVGESRCLVSQQLQGMAGIIAGLAGEINSNLYFDEAIEKELILELDKRGIEIEDLAVLKNVNDKYEINIDFKPRGNINNYMDTTDRAVNDVVCRRFVRDNAVLKGGFENPSFSVKYLEEHPFQVISGISRTGKQDSEKCGDNYTFMQLKDGRYILALSDGMGSGLKASKESNVVITLLEQLLDSGFDKDTTVRLINSILVLKSPNESFATIDLSMIDLFAGNVEFAKIGSASTFIKRGTKIEVIKSTSLPVGMLESIDMEITGKTLGDGDFIIMMTDGILDSDSENENKEQWVIDMLSSIETVNPQEIADALLRRAIQNYNGILCDDMTVIAAKVWKKFGHE